MQPVILSTNTRALEEVKRFLSTRICPILIDISQHYKLLEMGPFTQDVYEDIVMNRMANIETRFREHVDQEIQKSKLSTPLKKMMDSEKYITECLDPLSKSLAELFSEMTTYENYVSRAGEASFSDIEIINSLPKVKEEVIERRYQIIVEAPEQFAILSKMQELIRVYDELRNDTLKVGVHIMPDFQDYFTVQENSSLIINPNLFGFFEKMSDTQLKALRASPFFQGKLVPQAAE